MVLFPAPAGPSIATMICFRPVVPINLSILHHELDPPEHAGVFQRISVHTDDVGSLTIWREPQTLVCEIRDSGYIADPFAGRYWPNDASDHGRGLWMANQLCDLVQIRSGEQGTTIRLHVNLPAN